MFGEREPVPPLDTEVQEEAHRLLERVFHPYVQEGRNGLASQLRTRSPDGKAIMNTLEGPGIKRVDVGVRGLR
jgi:hypothetical protein